MTISNTAAWDALPMDSRIMFYDIASKESSTMTGAEWFYHLVPTELQDNPQEIEVFMNGGTVTQEVWVYDQGRAGGHYEQVEFNIADKDVSRIQSGHNGGEYTAENTVMEDASANRARGAEDMSAQELDSIQEANALEAELIDGSDVLLDSSETAVDTLQVAANTTEAADGLLEAVFDGVLPATYGAKAAQAVWESTDGMDTGERVAVTALGGGTAVLGTYTALSMVPGLNLVLGGIALYKVGTAAHKWWNAEAAETEAKAYSTGKGIGSFLS